MNACVDLFCGCGGLSLGASAAGFEPRVAVDVDSVLSSSYERNHKRGKLLVADLFELEPSILLEHLGSAPFGVFGGPPCQGFSSIGRRIPNDPRNDLILRFFHFVSELRPAFFIMENVPGLLNARNRPLLDDGLRKLPRDFVILEPKIVDASKFGAATRRRRVFVVGADTSQIAPFPSSLLDPPETDEITVQDAIGGLPPPGKKDKCKITLDPFGERLDLMFSPHDMDYREKGVSGFQCTTHRLEIQERFSKVPQGGKDTKSRYPRLAWDKPAPTLRAGTGSDRGSFQAARPIHPVEPRVISVREAARIQGFPDWFEFHDTKWHSHRMIGNSVSPIVSRAIFSRIANHVSGCSG
ncbi:DNA (cytosine-5)-methyltransferase 1 [Lutimaribacter saemankumensis]|uniref:DNA (cytosine-5-)-methyltransferase n=2 Tax=Lutimaribacter saemankumensis TaxID=490829 RepID=A0A1G8NMF0_9RHOB|nr:DNA (cytosine-5)-methyltransferase 1 [Lutimaribacter saemankumensis]